MEFRILGPLAVEGDRGPLGIGGRKEQAVLALLVVEANRVVSVGRLVDELWGEDAPPSATKTIRSYVSRLRKRLGGDARLSTEAGGYVLHAGSGEVDSERFEEMLGAALGHRGRGAHLLAADQLAGALELWRGTALAGFEDHPFAQIEAARLEERRLEALEARIDSDLEVGRHQRLVSELEQLVEQHPYREGLWLSLMLALYRSGRQTEALRAYREAHRRLGEEIGIEPSPELQALEQSILLQDAELEAPAAIGVGHNLPNPRNSFVGRDDELGDVRELLADYRCVTLTGVGGSGKTRLGVEAARRVVDLYRDGVWLVELAALTEPEGLGEHILLAFGEPGSHAENPAQALSDHVGSKRVLLLLDNCEHLTQPVAEMVDRLLDGCPNLAVLATSREPIGVAGEAIFRVPPLAVPAADATDEITEVGSVRLFVDRVLASRRDFDLEGESGAAVATVCRRLDGIPLAIELAAARARTLSVTEIAARLDDRFVLLTEGSRAAPARQRTLLATIDWSYDLLSDAERLLFQRLSVFAGPWTADAAHEVTRVADSGSETIVLVGQLVDKSLLERAGGGRYRLLETIRQYAFDRLVVSGDAVEVSRRHRDWYLALAREAEPALRGPDQREWWTRLEGEHDNLRAAIRWSFDTGDPTTALNILSALGWFWFMRGYWREAERWLERGLSAEGGHELARAEAIYKVGGIEVIRANPRHVLPLFDEALATFRRHGDSLGEAWCIHFRGHAAMYMDRSNATAQLVEALELFEEVGDRWSIAWGALYAAGAGGDLDEEVAIAQRSVEFFSEVGDRWTTAFALYGIGSMLVGQGRLDEGEPMAREARDLARELGDVVWEAHATRTLASIAYQRDELDSADSLFLEASEKMQLIGDENCSAISFGHLGVIAARKGDPVGAAGRYAMSMRIYRKIGSRYGLATYLDRTAHLCAFAGEFSTAARFSAVAALAFDREDFPRASPFEGDQDVLHSMLADALDSAEQRRLEIEAHDLPLETTVDSAIAWCEAFATD